MVYLNEYEMDRAYGGPEEGGWWYDTGRFIKCHGEFANEDEYEYKAIASRKGLEGYLAGKRVGMHSPGSVRSEGRWPQIVLEYEPGRDFPKERPHYE